MTQQLLDTILNDSVFSDCIAEAAPYRVKIIKDVAPQMKEVQDTYLNLLKSIDYLNVSQIEARLQKDKKDETAKAEYSEWKRRAMKMFRATLKTIHPNEGQIPGIGMLYAAGSMLEYIDRSDLIMTNPNYDHSQPLKFKKLEDANAGFDNDDVRAQMKQIFKDADEVQGEMCQNSDMIKIDIYEKLPAEVKYDKKLNKRGLKAGNFCALVKHKAMGILKDKNKYTKYISNQVNNSNYAIDREEVVRGKTLQM